MSRMTFYKDGYPCYRTKTYSEVHGGYVDTVVSGGDVASKLAAYEDSEEQGRLVVLPYKVGDTVYSHLWDVKSEKYLVCIGEIKNVRYDSVDGSVTVSDGEYYRYLGRRCFLTRAEAEAALRERQGADGSR